MQHIDPVPKSTRALPAAPVPPGAALSKMPKARGSAPRSSLALPGDGVMPTVKVRATQDGFYGWMMRRAGDVFDIAAEPIHEADVKTKGGTLVYLKGHPVAFSPFWMEFVDPATPYRVTTAPDELRRKNEEMVANSRGATGDQAVV